MDKDPKGAEGEDVDTPADSPSGTITPEPTGDDNPEGASPASPEEVAWSNLKGGTQDRIKDILRERDDWKVKAERLDTFVRNQPGTSPQPTNANLNAPEVQNARKVLSDIGFPTEDKVDQKINQGLGQIIYNFELRDLERTYDGSNNLPKFDKAEYEDFVQRNPKYQNYDPKDVYNIMYEEEILDAKLKGRGEEPQPSTNSSLRPTKTTVREEQWTPDWLENRMKQPDGLDWYAKNKDKVNNWLASQTPE